MYVYIYIKLCFNRGEKRSRCIGDYYAKKSLSIIKLKESIDYECKTEKK